MSIELQMPKLAMGMNEGTVNEWLVQQGERVEKGQQIMTIETEKVAYECESPVAGFLLQQLDAGETVPVDTVIGQFFETEAELAAAKGGNSAPAAASEAAASEAPAATSAAAPASQKGARIIASPLARKIAKDNGLDLSLVVGTGPNGRIVKSDVMSALASATEPPAASPAPAAADGMVEVTRIPMKGIRKAISDRMKQSLRETAQLSSAWDSDITELLALRGRFVARADALGTKVSMNSFIIKAIATAAKQVPIANTCLQGDEAIVYKTINMGVAVSTPGTTEYDKGLVVGVLRNVESMGVVDIDKAMKALVHRIRNGEATAEDLSGATITLSSTVGTAPPGTKSTPVLNLPNAALVGTSTPIEKPVVVNGEIVVRTMMPLCMTFDHCILDGEPATHFMTALHDCLENPELMLA